jgi:hypothetical protein
MYFTHCNQDVKQIHDTKSLCNFILNLTDLYFRATVRSCVFMIIMMKSRLLVNTEMSAS